MFGEIDIMTGSNQCIVFRLMSHYHLIIYEDSLIYWFLLHLSSGLVFERMGLVGKSILSEEDIKLRYITPAILGAGWDRDKQVSMEYTFTAGRIILRGNITARGRKKAPISFCHIRGIFH